MSAFGKVSFSSGSVCVGAMAMMFGDPTGGKFVATGLADAPALIAFLTNKAGEY